MEVINGDSLAKMCDYSFGDHLAVCDSNLSGGYKVANMSNAEFLLLTQKYVGQVMTLFIDNIRLYNRPLEVKEGPDANWVAYLLTFNDLLALCSQFPQNKFVIFTSHEDTPIDEHIKIPPNVLGIHATNAVYNNETIHPFPYGLQRKMGKGDDRHRIMKEEVVKDERLIPTKLLYINCGLGTERNAKERAYLPHFERYEWATCRFDKDSKFFPYSRYRDFLDELREHKFIICPQGHGIDCHRNWETLYMRRVPVMKESPYFRRLMKGFPVLFVDDWSEVTEELLNASEHLYEEAQKMELSTLNLSKMYDKIMKEYELLSASDSGTEREEVGPQERVVS